MTINIDTCSEEGNIINLDGAQNQTEPNNHQFLTQLDQLLSEHHVKPDQITAVTVNPGPGKTFTRTRLGVVFANALAFALNIKVNQKEFETPIYDKEPNITLKQPWSKN